MAAMIMQATNELIADYGLFDEADRIEHYRHAAAVAMTASQELDVRNYAAELGADYDFWGDLNELETALSLLRSGLIEAIAHLCVPDLAWGLGLTKDALAGYIHSTDIISEKEQADIFAMFEALDDAEDIIAYDEGPFVTEDDEEEDIDDVVWDVHQHGWTACDHGNPQLSRSRQLRLHTIVRSATMRRTVSAGPVPHATHTFAVSA
jgi:hypothetical protein